MNAPAQQQSIALVAVEVGPHSGVANRALGQVENERITAAARGDTVAQRALVHGCRKSLDDPAYDVALKPLIALEALFHARFLASHGVLDDIFLLACILLKGAETMYAPGREEMANHMGAEAISLLELLADEGEDEAAIMLNTLAEQLPPYILNQARIISKGEAA